jgi:hypothetical protein
VLIQELIRNGEEDLIENKLGIFKSKKEVQRKHNLDFLKKDGKEEERMQLATNLTSKWTEMREERLAFKEEQNEYSKQKMEDKVEAEKERKE